MSINDWLIVVISFLALIVSWRGYVLAKKSSHIAEQNYKAQLKEISPYLIESMMWKNDEKIYASFAVKYTNEATIQNSIKDIYLKLKLNSSQEECINACISPSTVSPEFGGQYKTLDFPMLLTGREAISGWVTFELPKQTLNNTTVEVYTLKATTATGNVIKKYMYLILNFIRPAELNIAIEFELAKHSPLIDGIILNKGLYIRSCESSDRVSEDFNAPSILIEVPEETIPKCWSRLYQKLIIKKLKQKGCSKKETTNRAIEYIKQTRELWGKRNIITRPLKRL